MRRDQYKTDRYFEEYIEYERGRVLRFSNALPLLKDTETSKRKTCERYIASFEKNILTAMYSAGASVDEVKAEFDQYLNALKKCGVSDYSEMVDFLSLAVLFGITEDEAVEIMKQTEFDDSLVRVLKEYLRTKKIMIQNGELKFASYYQVFWDYLTRDSGQADNELLRYMDEKWYASNEEMAWYESHKSDQATYAGYWCWLAGAALKIKGTNIPKQGMKYVPVDLIG